MQTGYAAGPWYSIYPRLALLHPKPPSQQPHRAATCPHATGRGRTPGTTFCTGSRLRQPWASWCETHDGNPPDDRSGTLDRRNSRQRGPRAVLAAAPPRCNPGNV